MEIQSEENKRTFELKSGNKVVVTRRDPFGLWYISFDKGAVPKSLSGSYTTFALALRDINSWIEKNDKELGKPDPIPELKTKRVKQKENNFQKESVLE